MAKLLTAALVHKGCSDSGNNTVAHRCDRQTSIRDSAEERHWSGTVVS